MSRPRLLVVTTVHRPDDPRIRDKLIPTLAPDWEIDYAAKDPGPSDLSGLTWVRLSGGRMRRWLRAARLVLADRSDLVGVHDPELLPPALIRSWLGRPTVFDLHENLPAQVRHKSRLPRPMRPLLAWLSQGVLLLAERTMVITLAEIGYGSLFSRSHPVIPNHLDSGRLPDPVPDERFFVYLGDVTEQRGCLLAIDAAAGAGLPLRLVGRVAPPNFGAVLERRAGELDVDLILEGELPYGAALARMAGATAGLSPLLDLPNYRHSLPTKVLEYLAVGLPVLTSDLPGTTEVIGDLDGVVVVPAGDREAWRDAGAEVGADPTHRASAQSQAAEIRARFVWPAATVTAVYSQAASRGHRC